MTDFSAREPVSSFGEQSVDGGTDERRKHILARAREIIERIPTPAETEEDEARRKRLAVAEEMPDLATLQTRWLTGGHLSDDQFCEMRRLEALAKIAPAAPPAPPKPATISRKAPSRLANAKLLERARKAELEIKFKAGGRWTDEERAEWLVIRGMEICDETEILLKQNRTDDAFAVLVKEIMAISFSQSRNRERLEDRVARLEKPRVRVKAIQQVIA